MNLTSYYFWLVKPELKKEKKWCFIWMSFSDSLSEFHFTIIHFIKYFPDSSKNQMPIDSNKTNYVGITISSWEVNCPLGLLKQQCDKWRPMRVRWLTALQKWKLKEGKEVYYSDKHIGFLQPTNRRLVCVLPLFFPLLIFLSVLLFCLCCKMLSQTCFF